MGKREGEGTRNEGWEMRGGVYRRTDKDPLLLTTPSPPPQTHHPALIFFNDLCHLFVGYCPTSFPTPSPLEQLSLIKDSQQKVFLHRAQNIKTNNCFICFSLPPGGDLSQSRTASGSRECFRSIRMSLRPDLLPSMSDCVCAPFINKHQPTTRT